MLLVNYILDICKYIPSMIIVSSLSIGIIFNNIRGYIFFIISILCNIINVIFKNYIFKPLYYKTGNKSIFLLGRGDRPRGHPKLDMLENYYKDSISYGMPSGHSQFICFFSTFWISYFLYNKTKCKIANLNKLSAKNNLSITYLIFIAILVMYSRYTYKYHTIQQVFIGGFIGIIIGILFFILFKKQFTNKKYIPIKKKIKKYIPPNKQHENEILMNINQNTSMNRNNSMNQNRQLNNHTLNPPQYNNDINKVLQDMDFKQQSMIESSILNENDKKLKEINEYKNSPPINKINII